MNDSGRAAVVLDTGALTRGSGSKNEDKERNIRKWFVDRDYVEGAVLLPDNLFYNTQAAGIIIILNKRKPTARQSKVLMLNASHRATKGRPKNHLAENDVLELARLYQAAEPVEGELAVVDIADIAAADYTLSPARWAGSVNQAEHRTVADIAAELVVLDQRSTELDRILWPLIKRVMA